MLELFLCPRHPGNLRLTVSSCAASWERVNRTKSDESPCFGCPIGAAHAGAPLPIPANKAVADICPRCRRTYRRLVKGVCVCCYNRQRESDIGANRRGNPPRTPPSEVVSIGVAGLGQYQRRATSVAEVAIAAAQATVEAAMFFRLSALPMPDRSAKLQL